MKVKMDELMNRPEFQYLFGNYTIELNEIELALLDFPSSLSRMDAAMKWHDQGPRNLK